MLRPEYVNPVSRKNTMAIFNFEKHELDLKIVYCGPGLCGKTTNVQHIHKMLGPSQCGELVSLPTKDDRTLFFDFLLMERYISGLKTRFHIYTVPGQVQYALTRRSVLVGVDGIVFVVDSQADKLQDNIDSLKDVDEQLRFYKKGLASLPWVLQYNKRDLPDIVSVEELNAKLNRQEVPYFEACALTGMGVGKTLYSISKMVQKHYDNAQKSKR